MVVLVVRLDRPVAVVHNGVARARRREKSHLSRLIIYHGSLDPGLILALALHHKRQAPIGRLLCDWEKPQLCLLC